MPTTTQFFSRRLALVVIAATTPFLSGCLFVAAGAAVGAGAAGYYYFATPLYQDYPTANSQTTVAVRAALVNLGYPPPTEEAKEDEVRFETRAPDKTRVTIVVKPIPNKVPATQTSRVSVQVGTINDNDTCNHIHGAIRKQLGLPDPQPAAQSGASPQTSQRLVPQPVSGPGPVETGAPPLAR